MAGPINYRRGFQRVYLVLSALWMILLLTWTIADRPKEGDFTPPPLSSWKGPPATSGGPIDYAAMAEEAQRKADSAEHLQSQKTYWLGSVAVVAIPPLFGYAVLFIVLPWIARGFSRTS